MICLKKEKEYKAGWLFSVQQMQFANVNKRKSSNILDCQKMSVDHGVIIMHSEGCKQLSWKMKLLCRLQE